MKILSNDWLLREPGARDFAAIYLAHFDELSDLLETRVAPHPVLGSLVVAMTEEHRRAAREASREKVCQAFAGHWDTYSEALRRDGARYAAMGLPFRDWYALASVWSRLLVPLLVEGLGAEPVRLTAALVTMQAFVDSMMGVLSEAYIAASEARVRHSEEDLRATLDSIADAVIATDADGRVVRLNTVAASLLGCSVEAAKGRPLAEVWHVRSDPWAPEAEGAFELVNEEGANLPILASRAAIVRADGQQPGEVIVFRDVSVTRRHERELRRWEALFKSVPWGLCVTDASGQVIELVNEAFARAYKSDVTAMRGRTLESLYAPDALVQVRALQSERARRTGSASFETIHVRDDGSRFPVQVDAARIPGLDGREAWTLNVRDLTERRQIEALSVRGAELEAENRRVQEASRLKSEFLANMSHELRTPLNAILGFSELLHAGDVGALTDKQQDFVGDIYTSGKHLLRLINDVLDLSKVEAGKMEFYPESTRLLELIHEVTDGLRSVARDKEIVPVVSVAEGVEVVLLDPGRLKQVLYNFLSNAIKFSPPRGEVRVSVRPHGPSSFRLEVSDQGAGISADNQRRLFVEFEQLDRGRAKTHGGTGLGLALTRRLVEAQGGTVGVQSTPGVGSVFHAVLPLRSPARGSLPQPRHIEGPYAGAPRVLVIEDDAADQERIVNALLSAGYAVDTASTGAQALRAVSERDYQAITLDLVLPDTSGFTMLVALREHLRAKEVPVIVISLLSEQVNAGFLVHDVLQKPLQSDCLLASLQRAGVSPPGAGPILVVDDDEPSANLMVASLEQLGFRTTVAHDGQQALERARQERPAAVVLDLVMPELDGFGFLHRFRAEPAWAGIPVLIWTVEELSADEHRTLLQQAGAVLPKDGTGVRTVVELLRAHLPTRTAVMP